MKALSASIFSKYLSRSNRSEAPSRLFSSYSMRARKIFALLDGPEEDTFIDICFGAQGGTH